MEKPAEQKRTPRFKFNPVEFVIFALLFVVFLNSAYRLSFDWQNFKVQDFAKSKPGTSSEVTERNIAGTMKAKGIVYLTCGDDGKITISKNEATGIIPESVKLSSPYCGLGLGSNQAPSTEAVSVKVFDLGQENKEFSVFLTTEGFSTDFIDLKKGPNTIRIELSSGVTKAVSQSLITLNRN